MCITTAQLEILINNYNKLKKLYKIRLEVESSKTYSIENAMCYEYQTSYMSELKFIKYEELP